MACRCPTATKFGSGTISDYELQFRRVATIIPKTDSVVPVLLWELEPSDEKSLDRYEGYPNFYHKEYFELEINGENRLGEIRFLKKIDDFSRRSISCSRGSPRLAMAYVMNGGQINIPSEAYYNGIEKGYLDNGLDTAYLEKALEQAYQSVEEVRDCEEGFQFEFEQ